MDRALFWYVHSALWGRFAGSTVTVLNQDYEVARARGIDGLIATLYFFFSDTPTTEIYTLSLHDALPISILDKLPCPTSDSDPVEALLKRRRERLDGARRGRSEEHTSELQSRRELVCRLLLEKKNSRPGPTWTEPCSGTYIRPCGGGSLAPR